MRPREICSFVGIFENVRGISKVVENVRERQEGKRKGSKLEAQKEVGKRRLVCTHGTSVKQRTRPKYGFPGGGRRGGECTLRDCIRRLLRIRLQQLPYHH